MNVFQIIVLSSVYVSLFTFFLWLFLLLDLKEPKATKRKYSITFIIPVYNEEKNIEKTINSILNLNYGGKIKIIVVDDVSTDKTVEICRRYEEKGIIKFIRKKKHSGKVNSVNIALKHVDTDLFAILDADTYFEKNAIRKMVSYFDDPKVGAVLAALKVENDKGIIPRLQVIEYYFSVFLRKLMSCYDGLYTTHGATLFRTSAIREVGEFDEENLVEDMDIALRLMKRGYKVVSDLEASAYTIVPDTFFKLLKQRIRWYGGFIYNTLFKHRDMLFNKKYPGLSFITIPLSYFWILIAFFTVFGFVNLIVTNAIYYYTLLSNVGLDLANQFMLSFNFMFMISMFSLGLFIVLLKVMKSKLNVKLSPLSIVLYLAFFSILSSLFWVASLPRGLRGKVTWKN